MAAPRLLVPTNSPQDTGFDPTLLIMITTLLLNDSDFCRTIRWTHRLHDFALSQPKLRDGNVPSALAIRPHRTRSWF